MAGDWIKMRVDLADDPAVVAMASALKLHEYEIIGRLHRIWSWADKHTTHGHASVTVEWIDRFVACSGFASAMVSVGWLGHHDDSIVFPNFKRHNGKTAKQRALTQKRVVTHRKRTGRFKSVTREEKRREELKATPIAPSADALDASKAVIFVPLTGGEEFPVFEADVTELGALYPALDVLQTLREIRGWNIANPTRRKTRSGIMRHIHQWFAREQNKAPA